MELNTCHFFSLFPHQPEVTWICPLSSIHPAGPCPHHPPCVLSVSMLFQTCLSDPSDFAVVMLHTLVHWVLSSSPSGFQDSIPFPSSTVCREGGFRPNSPVFSKQKKKRRRIDRTMIGEPMNFVHLTHIGSGEMGAGDGLAMVTREWGEIDMGS